MTPDKNSSARKAKKSPAPKKKSTNLKTLSLNARSQKTLAGISSQDGILSIPYATVSDLSQKLARLTAHVMDAQAAGALPTLTVGNADDTIDPDAADGIVIGCAGSDDWSMTVGDCVNDVDQFRACLSRGIRADGYQVPRCIASIDASMTLGKVAFCVAEAYK